MEKVKNKDVEQLIHISKTIIEGLEQLLVFQRENKQRESIYIFGTIVEGVRVIDNWIKKNNEVKEKVMKLNKNIEKNILVLAKNIETNNTSKCFEILQFSLIPQVKQLKTELSKQFEQVDRDEVTSIGIYYCQDDPMNIMPQERIRALAEEAEMQNAKLIFFTSKDVDFKNKSINAKIYNSSAIKTQVESFPVVVHNIGPNSISQRSNTEKKLRKQIPFTTFGIGDKLNLPSKFVTKKLFVELLVPFKVMTDVDITINFIEKNRKVVIKPIRGRQGQKIYFIEKKSNNSYQLKDHKKKLVLNYAQLIEFIKALLSEKDHYMVQKFILSQTKDRMPFDIRAHMQKNGNGEWEITKIYPRIGNKKSILSNISRGGKAAFLEEFLRNEYGETMGSKLEKDLLELSMDLVFNTDKLYGSALDELGLDLAIDENYRIWLHEINAGPQTTYHEEERAVNAIAYAKYIAGNGLYLTNEFDSQKGSEVFNINQSRLEYYKSNARASFGMLIGTEKEDSAEVLKEACAYVANYEKVNYFYFHPQDVDIYHQKIKGFVYEENNWVSYIFDYPDVVIDRFRMREIKGYDNVYQELAHLPFTNVNKGGSMNKLDLYNLLKKIDVVNDYLIPYKEVTSIDDLKSLRPSRIMCK